MAKTNCQGAAENEMIYRGLVAKLASRTEDTAQGDQGGETGTAGVTPTTVVRQPKMIEEKAAKGVDAAETNCQGAAEKKLISSAATDCQGCAKNEMIYRGLVATSASRAEDTAQGDQGRETGTVGVTLATIVRQPEMFKEETAKGAGAAKTNCQGAAETEMIYRGSPG